MNLLPGPETADGASRPSPDRTHYDHRLRRAVVRSGDPLRFAGLVPLSTARSWIRRGMPEVVTTAEFDTAEHERLAERVAQLERVVRVLRAWVALLFALIETAGARLEKQRLPEAGAKQRLLRAMGRAWPVLGGEAVLGATGSISWLALCFAQPRPA